jgi:ribosomal protein S18 acetylase RimI-like enzyme
MELLSSTIGRGPMQPRKANRKTLRIRIRPATRADLDALLELERRVFAFDQLSRQSLRRLVASATARVIVAAIDGRVAGAAVVLFRPRSAVARLYSIAVAPQLSGRGVGSALLAAAETAAMVGRCRCLRLEVHETNAAAIARYRKSGYRQFGRLDAYYEDGGDALRFEKSVAAQGKPLR